MTLMGQDETSLKRARQALALLCCWLLVACAGPLKLYEGDDLPAEETAVIEYDGDYAILSFDGFGPIPEDEKSVEVLPGQHQLIAYHRWGTECGGSGGGSNVAHPVGLAAIVVVGVLSSGCYLVSNNTHCANLDFVVEAGHEYEMTAGNDDKVVLIDSDIDAVVARADRIYREDESHDAFLGLCRARALESSQRP